MAQIEVENTAPNSELTLEKLVSEVREANDSLYALVPFLEDAMASSWTALSDGPLMVGIKTFWGEKSGTRNIQGKFPHRDERVSKDKSESYSQPGVALH
jgi:hypothetical protein